MMLFNGKYAWDGSKGGAHKPVSWWPGAHFISIFDLSHEKSNVLMLKPIVVLALDTQEGYSMEKRYQDLIMGVCREFGIPVQKVLWVKLDPDHPKDMRVAMMEASYKLKSGNLYDVKWRHLMPNEKEIVEQLLPLSTLKDRISEKTSKQPTKQPLEL